MSFNPDLNGAQKVTNARNKLTAKCLITFSHYTKPHLEYDGLCKIYLYKVYMKNNLSYQINMTVYKFMFVL